MTRYICETCGTQFAETDAPPPRCPICEEPRQYIGHRGQRWTTLEEVRAGHDNVFRPQEDGLLGIGTLPSFGIGQRALLVRTPEGNVLWDCIALLDEPTETMVRALGGVDVIAISHPHYYTTMVEWAHAFGATVHLHAADRQWVMRDDPAIRYWEGGTLPLFGGITLINAGGHFDGGTVLHWPGGGGGRGALLSGDILQVVQDRRWVSFMYSYPNIVPLPAWDVERLVATIEPYGFDRLYGAFWPSVVASDAKAAARRSAERYVAALNRPRPEPVGGA
jgi:hypothetical protein